MADISKIKAINGTTYNLKDATARKVIIQGTDSSVYNLQNVTDVQFKRFEAEGWVNAGHLQGTQTRTSNPTFYLPDDNGGTLATTDDVSGAVAEVNSDTALARQTMGTRCKNLLKNTAKTTTTADGATFTVNADGSVTLDKNPPSATRTLNVMANQAVPESWYGQALILSGCPAGGSSTSYRIALQNADTGANIAIDSGNGAKFTLTSAVSRIRVALVAYTSTSYSNITFRPMIRSADITDDTFEAYQPSLQEQIDELRSLISG